MTIRIIGCDGQTELEALRLFRMPAAAPAVLNGTPLLTGALFGSRRRGFRGRCRGICRA
jgi:hypothetical protein